MNKDPLCRFCKCSDTSKQYSAIDIFGVSWDIRNCNNCKAFFLSPFPTSEQLQKSYDSSYYGEGEHKFSLSVERFIDYFRRRKARKISSIISEKARVLDIGCGNGRFLKYLSSLGHFELYGTELDGGSAKRASQIKEINLKVGNLSENDFPEDFFDAVTLFHVFEHLEDPRRTIEIIGKILKKNGVLVMTFPNIDGWQAKIFKGKWYHLDPPRHLFFIAPKDLVKIMDEMGFLLIKKNYFSFEQNPYGWVQSILNSWSRKREFLYERLKGNRDYASEKGFGIYLLQLSFFVISFPCFVVIDAVESLLGKSATVRIEFRRK